MEKSELQKFCDSGLSQREIAKKFGTSQSIIQYWMAKHGLKNNSRFFLNNRNTKRCPSCNVEKSIGDFYKREGKKGCSTYCKTCTQERVTNRHDAFKKLCVEYKGGKCQACGYDKCLAALEFHHRDPEEKDYTISQKSFPSFDEAKKELDKCDLLCCRCHREIHG
jgi:hypothetical protein